ncbi:ankyrin repeat domain-containing protein [Ahniella affigens]|uniref:ankyrin repeat domain-containing protein n=1 Tax=Ahniella affigens TaxID=2021234 RepID=UPI0014728527|nr:ankyrin repeat domain-containing protein [Ahniella affigens]
MARIRAILDAGFDLSVVIDGKAPINYLIEMYFRSDRFPECLRLLLERGAILDDPKIEAILLDDPIALDAAVARDPSLLAHRTSMRCAFTPLIGATLLHVAAEYGHLKVAQRLLELGVNVDDSAAVDAFGLNGHTPLFHTVNANGNRSLPVMRLLLDAGASPTILLPGITWGQGFDWETTCLDVTPISYAQLGLLPQMHRTELDTYANIKLLLRAAGRVVPALPNVPNRYLGER